MGRNHTDSTGSDTRGERTAAGLDDDQLYRGLASAERRRIVYSLLTVGPATAEQLATLLAGWHATDTSRMVSEDTRDRLLTELVHVHLPMLEEAGLAVRDDESGGVKIGALDPAVMKLVRDSIAAESSSRE